MHSLKFNQTLALLFLLVLSFFTNKMYAQNGTNQLIINSQDSSQISLFINQRLICSSYTNKLRVGNLINESHQITIALDSSLKKVSKSIFFNQNEAVIYLDLICNDSINHIVFNGESKIKDIVKGNTQKIYMYYDSIVILDSIVGINKAITNELLYYKGNIGCDQYINNIDSILINLESIYSSEKKLNYLNVILENTCLSTKQLKTLLLAISYEDHRIELCEKLYPEIYDLDNFHLLIELFKFEKSKNLFLKIIEEYD